MKSIARNIFCLTILALCATSQAISQTDRQSLIPVYESTIMQRTILNEAEIVTALETLPGWEHVDGKLVKTYNCGSFKKSIAFIVAMSYHCEALDHHPEIFNVYGKVQFSTTTYDIGQKVTTDDIKLATAIETTAEGFVFKTK
jgi:4a-hydroxytetrahydrobiopterin dehydratase